MSGRRWLVLTVGVPSDELSGELAEGLLALGGTAVQEDGDRLTTFVPEPADPDALLRGAADALGAVVGGAPDLDWRWQGDQDWARLWKAGLEPQRVGRRLVVTQPWNPVEPADDDVVITIEPASAFGTGEHATTRGALRLLESCVAGGERVLDVGTGSGILAIAAVRLGAHRVVAVESDAGSMDTARENLDRNAVAEAVELVHGRVDPPYLAAASAAGFDVIVANVLSGVLIPLLGGFMGALRPAGRLILGGILQSESDAVLRAAEAEGLRAVREDREQEWWTALLRPAGG